MEWIKHEVEHLYTDIKKYAFAYAEQKAAILHE